MTWKYLDLDGALTTPARSRNWPIIDARSWGPRLRFCAPEEEIEAFSEWVRSLQAPFTLFGSGDFHHLSAIWQKRLASPYVLISFDNHPDWDTRPPLWACGGWINRALDNPLLTEVQVWGCGNFELWWPNRLFANEQALSTGKLIVRPWEERLTLKRRERYPCINRSNWKEHFARQVAAWKGKNVYVTVDLDCLVAGKAFTNWENGLFEPEDIAEAIRLLRTETTIVGGDLCGVYSPGAYTRWTQKFCAWFDHPPIEQTEIKDPFLHELNLRAIDTIWPVLVGE